MAREDEPNFTLVDAEPEDLGTTAPAQTASEDDLIVRETRKMTKATWFNAGATAFSGVVVALSLGLAIHQMNLGKLESQKAQAQQSDAMDLFEKTLDLYKEAVKIQGEQKNTMKEATGALKEVARQETITNTTAPVVLRVENCHVERSGDRYLLKAAEQCSYLFVTLGNEGGIPIKAQAKVSFVGQGLPWDCYSEKKTINRRSQERFSIDISTCFTRAEVKPLNDFLMAIEALGD